MITDLVENIEDIDRVETKLMNAGCNSRIINEEALDAMFDDAGVFTGKQDAFFVSAEAYGIDPVLLIGIAMLETGRGTSSAAIDKNNPGGMMNPRTDALIVYNSIEDGIEAMANNLYRLYIKQGLYTVEQIGPKYAPIGATNDLNDTNQFWIPQVTQIAEQLGGLAINCK